MDLADTRRRQTGPRELGVRVTLRYRFMWLAVRLVVRSLVRIRVSGLEHWPAAPFQIVSNHHNGADPLLVIAVTPLEPRITWFGPRERDFSRGFKNRVMAFFGGVIPYHPEGTTLTSAVRAVRRVYEADGVLAIFAEGRIGFRESELLPFEEGAAAFALTAGVQVVPCAIVGSTELWLGRRIEVRFGPPLATEGISGREGRRQLEERLHEAVAAMLPVREPRQKRFRPLRVLTDILNGEEDIVRREADRAT